MSKLACVIGATGFVGSHVCKTLLERGWAVRAVSRNATNEGWLRELGDPSKVQLLNLDLNASEGIDAALDEAFKDCNAAFFAAGHEKADPATIDFMVNSAVAVVNAAKRTNVETVVLTSSGGSTNPVGLTNETPKSEILHWSDPDQQIAAGKYSPAAKTLMEINSLKAVGRDQQNNVQDAELAKSSPRLCIMNPNLILGPQLRPGEVKGNSLPWIVRILKGEAMNKQIPNDSMSIIDVRDLAALHVACAERQEASGRYFGVNRSFPWKDILSTFKECYPPYQLPPMFEGESKTPTQFDHTRKQSLGVELRDLQTTVKEIVAFLVESKMLEAK